MKYETSISYEALLMFCHDGFSFSTAEMNIWFHEMQEISWLTKGMLAA
jgi:hypothetical protein